MTISSLKIRPMLFGAAVALGALAPLPALAQYDNGYGGGYHQDDQPRYDRQDQPHCYYRNVRVYDDYYGRYVVRRQRVCDQNY